MWLHSWNLTMPSTCKHAQQSVSICSFLVCLVVMLAIIALLDFFAASVSCQTLSSILA